MREGDIVGWNEDRSRLLVVRTREIITMSAPVSYVCHDPDEALPYMDIETNIEYFTEWRNA